MGKICFFCGSKDVIRKGLKGGLQRWHCKSCGRYFTARSGRNSGEAARLYAEGNLTVKQVAERIHRSERTAYRHLSVSSAPKQDVVTPGP